MKIISLNETQFRNYSRIHTKRNYLQTVEYAKMQKHYGFDYMYVGLIDEDDNLLAAALILNKKVLSKFFYGIVPGGFLIDYANLELLKNFLDLLKEYLNKLDFVYLQVEPRCIINTKNRYNKNIFTNTNIIDNLDKLGVTFVDNNVNNKYAIYLNNTISDDKILYKKLSRSLKRTIKDCRNMGIKIYKGDSNNIDDFYNLIKKKTTQDIEYYKNYIEFFNNDNNSFEIYFAKLEPSIYLNNATTLLNREQKKNDRLNKKMQFQGNNIKDSLINSKIASDKRMQKYKAKLNNAIMLNNQYPNGVIVSACAIIKDNREITFLIDGYLEELRNIRASVMIKYEIIKMYTKEGFSNFNLGFLPSDQNSQEFRRIYASRIGFGAKFVEFPNAFHLIINKFLYNMPLITKNQNRFDS